MRKSRLMIGLLVTFAIILVILASLVASVNDLHDRLAKASPALATGFVVTAIAAASLCGLAAARLFWTLSRAERAPIKAPEDVVQAADVQVDKAEGVIEKVADVRARDRLRTELETIRSDRRDRRFHVVVFGTGSAGKTSLINALLGREVGKTDVILGTTKQGEKHSYEVEDVDGTVILTDTPGLSEIGDAGPHARPRRATSPPAPTCSCSSSITT